MNFTWWVNRKDPDGRNLFQGGFLGLDNIGVFDRSAPLPSGGTLEQADGTAWMALYCQTMLQMALELAQDDPIYADFAAKFGQHFVWIAAAMSPPDGRRACGTRRTASSTTCCGCPTAARSGCKVRSLVGLLPLCAATVLEAGRSSAFRICWRGGAVRRGYTDSIAGAGASARARASAGSDCSRSSTSDRLRRILRDMLDENEFLGPYGIRALSRYHAEHPFLFDVDGQRVPRRLPAGRVGHRHVRRQLQLARPGLVPDEPA